MYTEIHTIHEKYYAIAAKSASLGTLIGKGFISDRVP